MPRTYIAKRGKSDKNNSIRLAVQAVRDGASVRAASIQYKVDKTTVARNLQVGAASSSPKKSCVGQSYLPSEAEDELALCLTLKERWGYKHTKYEIQQFVKGFISINKDTDTPLGHHLKKTACRFTDDYPGDGWLRSFMARYTLSVEEPSKLEEAQSMASSNPETIYGYFDRIKREMDRLQIEGRPECVWNIDATRISTRKANVVAPVREDSFNTSTSERDIYTLLAGISASGKKLPPLILFKGKNLWSNWLGENAYPGTWFAKSENGCMTDLIFPGWFDKFCEKVRQRPLLLVYSGHTRYLNYAVIKKAMDEQITFVKLPSLTTNILQPLDVSCFKPFKEALDSLVPKWRAMKDSGPIKKYEFVDIVGEIWKKALTTESIQSSFSKTGLYPANESVYPVYKFKRELLLVYNALNNQEIHHIAAASRKREPRGCATTA